MAHVTVPVLAAPGVFSFVAAAEMDAAELAPGQALVRVIAGGVCGSDLPYYRGAPVPAFVGGTVPPAGYPMHEIVGEVVRVHPESSPGGESRQPGTQVVGWATKFDGLADFVVTDLDSLATFPDDLATEDAVLIQPLACVLYAVERLGDIVGRCCAVIGLGPIGLRFCHVLQDRGASAVLGVDRVDRADVAGGFGVTDLVWDSSERWAAGLGLAERPEVVIEAVGHQPSTLQHALMAVAPSGTVFYFGVNDDRVYPLDMDLMLRKNLTLMSGGTLHRQRMLGEAAEYLHRYPDLLSRSITHRYPRAEVQRAYDAAATPSVGRLKVVIAH
jgi:L-iditol 2-dehydrogenase